MQATDVFAQLASALSTDGDLHALLVRLLEPIARLSQARSATVSVAEGGRLRQLGILELSPAPAGKERLFVVALAHRGRSFGQYQLSIAADAVVGEEVAGFNRTIGALLGLALHDACVERESRQAVAADVHDGIAQTLAFARLRLPLLEEAIGSGDGRSALRYCAEVRQAIATAHTNLRAVLSQSSVAMDPKGLKHALDSSVQSFHRLTQIPLDFVDLAPDLHLSSDQEAQVFFIVQEALANIAKHAHARHAWLLVERQGDRVDVIVEDDGAGPSAVAGPASPSHLGQEIMRQRAARLGGAVEIAPRDGGGLRVRLSFPATAAEATTE
jgi:two-component system nitrate/nitrite sensor histidine kinase NarX